MGGLNSSIGLLFEINADPSKAQEAIDQFAGNVGTGFNQAAGATKPLNDALLSNRETVRLLSEEAGVHLPRAVSSAIAQMLPDIASLGTAFLGVFAVEEVVKFAEKVHKLADEFNGIAAAEKVMASVGRENDSIMENLARHSLDYARSQVTLLLGATMVSEANLENAKKADEGQTQQLAALIPIVTLYHQWFGASKDVVGAQKELARLTELRDKLAKILSEDETKAAKDAATAVERAAAAEQRRLEALNRFNQELVKEEAHYEKLWETMSKHDAAEQLELEKEADKALGLHSKHVGEAVGLFTQLGDAQWKLTDAQKNALPWLALENDRLVQMSQRSKEITEEIQNRDIPARRKIELEYERQIDASRRYVAQLEREVAAGKASADKLEAVKKQEAEAEVIFNQQRIASLKQLQIEQEKATMMAGVSLLQTLGFRKAAAITEAIWETAQAYAAFGRYDYWSGAQHLLAAAEYGVIAGQSGRGASAGGSSAGPATAAGTVAGSQAPLAPGATPGQQHNIVVKIESDIPYTIKKISHEVTHNDANLIARQSRHQTPFGGR
jgi:hypothetical protein